MHASRDCCSMHMSQRDELGGRPLSPQTRRKLRGSEPSSTMGCRAGFHSCNGLSVNSDLEKWGTPHLWQDVLREHEARPLHAMVGGGDQVYNDAVWKASSLKAWLDISNTEVAPPGSVRGQVPSFCNQWQASQQT